MSRTLVTFHAHPDDEALLTAGVMAQAAAAGDRVVLVVATRGEVGEVATDFLESGEALATRRVAETEASAAALGVSRVEFLGYRDSGLDSSCEPGTFLAAPIEEAAARLAAILSEEHAEVLTTYDPNGGYGHPDHVRVHEVGRRAGELAGTPTVLEATINRDLLRLAAELAPTLGLDLPADVVPPDLDSWFSPADEITHTVDVTDQLALKRAAMQAHASQSTAEGAGIRSFEVFLSLPEDLFALAFGTEWFIDRSRPDVRATSLFAPSPTSTS